MDTYIAPSKLGGMGTFAKKPIKKGVLIRKLTGEEITLEETINRIGSAQENADDPLQIGESKFIDLDEPSRQINHSCNPNSGIRGKSDLYAIRDIAPNDEITYDYSTTVSKNIPPQVWKMNCNCKEHNCRKTVSNVLTIPNSQLENYRKLKALPDYIIKQLK